MSRRLLIRKPAWQKTGLMLAAWLGLATLLSWAAGSFRYLAAWPSFALALVVGAAFLALGWRLLRVEAPPTWLAWAVLLAFGLRLGVGVLWFNLLPVAGHGTRAEQAGYIMADASERDQAAWKLAQSGKSLDSALLNNRLSDQYGGLLFLSAFIYRYLGGETHQPLLIVILTAAFSSLAVLFTWAFARQAWRDEVGQLAAWFLVFYPEAVLLGSSQMREGFVITLATVAFYGLSRFHAGQAAAHEQAASESRPGSGLAWILVALLACLPFSPPLTSMLLGMLVVAGLLTFSPYGLSRLNNRRFWLVAGSLVALILVGVYLALRRFTPEGMVNPLAMLSWWLRKSADLQAFLSQHASGWLQKVFRAAPEWLHLPLLVGYGVVQPFLPAALVVGSRAQLWPWIALWRSVGWTLLLGLLVYAPFAARWQWVEAKNPATRTPLAQFSVPVLCLVVWGAILVASFRGGGDMWDNPRYRAAFAGLQVALAAWAWLEQRQRRDPWFLRALVSLGAILAWFLPWYLRRYTAFEWPVVDLFKTLGLGAATAVLFGVWDWVRRTSP